MSNVTVRISNSSRDILRELAAQESASMQAILDKAIEAYRREVFLKAVNQAYVVLRQDPKAWSQMEKERGEWDATLSDGLDPEKWAQNGKALNKKRRGARG